ncbi:MAG TPA: DNA gyrase inhibitor YacG [Burkholderiales bacterium]
MQPVRQVACPRCGTLTPFTPENKWRPFCSERCKMIDLGAWASESYRVPAEEEDSPDDESSSSRPPES